MSIRVLQSFPHKIGAERIATTAWHQAVGVAAAGAELTVAAGVVHRPLPSDIRVWTTLSHGRYRLPYRALGTMRTLALHDRLVARSLDRHPDRYDIVHAWPLASLETIRVARRIGVPIVLERPNAHTGFAMEVVAAECDRIGVPLPPDHEHAYNGPKLQREEAEYDLADGLLCPSEFVVETFLDKGYSADRLVRHIYGYDETVYFPPAQTPAAERPINALFVGVCAVRKGVHFALEAWLRSPASDTGTFRIAGAFLPAYERKLADMLAHPSVEVLGHSDDVPALMRQSDILMLPSIEEGFGLTCAEAIGSDCVPLVSNACTDTCVNGENAFVHTVGDVDTLSDQITRIHEDRALLAELRAGCRRSAPDLTWAAAGRRLVEAYEQVLAARRPAVVGLAA
jgi:D-inositol-3-phosphate glycosyltransferase